MHTETYAEQMREAAQIDETGKSPEWVARFGRDAMLAKIEAWHKRGAEWDALPQAEKDRQIRTSDKTDYCSCGRTGCSCDNGN